MGISGHLTVLATVGNKICRFSCWSGIGAVGRRARTVGPTCHFSNLGFAEYGSLTGSFVIVKHCR